MRGGRGGLRVVPRPRPHTRTPRLIRLGERQLDLDTVGQPVAKGIERATDLSREAARGSDGSEANQTRNQSVFNKVLARLAIHESSDCLRDSVHHETFSSCFAWALNRLSIDLSSD